MKLKRVVSGVVAGLLISGAAYAAGPSCDEAANKLLKGNKTFCSGDCKPKKITETKRKELTKGQHPFAAVLTCSDSRVSPELLFDQGLGDIFVVRVAGNVVDPISIGSLEYSVEHLHTPLLVILGHQSCGAVKAALEAEGEAEGNIGEILKKIKPAVETAKAAGKKDEAGTLDLAVQENIKNVYNEIMEKSPIIKEFVEKGKLKVMVGEYYLDSGKVKMIEMAKSE